MRQRLINQRISAGSLRKPGEVVGWLGAVQAQDYAGAKWALGLRMLSASEAEIDQSFADGEILRTHAMRPTWHFVTPADIRWVLALTAPRVHQANAFMYRRLGLDAELFKRSNTVLENTFQGGLQLTRDELRSILKKSGIAASDNLRMAYIMMQAELDGLICSGARRGKQFTYALLDERVPPGKPMDLETSLAELARRYFASRGPATVQDFAKWSGLTAATANRGLEAVKDQLAAEMANGQVYWLPEPAAAPVDISPTAHILSIYDEYISGYKDRSALGDDGLGARLFALGNALTYIVVIDGQIVGTAKRKLTKNAVIVETKFFTTLSEPEHQAVRAAIRRYADFLNRPLIEG